MTREKITRLGIIGDVHAEHARLQLAINHLKTLSPQVMICTGDVVDGIGCADECVQLLRQSGVHTVRGNHDRWLLNNSHRDVPDAQMRAALSRQTIDWLSALPTRLTFNTSHGNLLLCHGVAENDLGKVWPGNERLPVERSHELDQIIKDGEYKYLVNGHMHYRTLIHFEGMTLINAGTLRGTHLPGFSMIDFAQQTVSAFTFRTEDDVIEVGCVAPLVDDKHVIWRDTQAFSGAWEAVTLA